MAEMAVGAGETALVEEVVDRDIGMTGHAGIYLRRPIDWPPRNPGAATTSDFRELSCRSVVPITDNRSVTMCCARLRQSH